ncbi:MAG: hypothetical protein ABL921_18815 [Pirellula sp.]
MKINRAIFLGMIVLSASTVGCGGIKEEKIPVANSAIVTNAKKTLQNYEKTGKLDSAITGLESDINGISSTDSAKGEALLKDYRELVGLTDAAKIKEKAKEMLGKL